MKRFSNGFSSTDPSGPPNGWPRSRWAVLGTVPTFLSQGVPPFPRTLPETTPAAQPARPPHAAARPPHVHRGRSPHRRLAVAQQPPPRRASTSAHAHQPRAAPGREPLRRPIAALPCAGSPVPTAAATAACSPALPRATAPGRKLLPRARARRPRAAQAAPPACSLARPSLGARAQACGRARGARGRAGRAGVRRARALFPRLSPHAPRAFLEPAFPGRRLPRLCLGLAWAPWFPFSKHHVTHYPLSSVRKPVSYISLAFSC